jgi:septum formation protein
MRKAKETIRSRPLVYLASGSPQRRAILEELGISYQLLSVDVEEIMAATPRETVEENASRKLIAGLTVAKKVCEKSASSGWQPQAQLGDGLHGERGSTPNESPTIPKAFGLEAATRIHMPAERGAVVIAADTVLEAQGRLLGKPADETAAAQYLQTLSGGSAVAYSAVAVAVAGNTEGTLATETAEVHFKSLPPEVIRWYLSTGEPMGRAGAFGIGRLGEVLTESIDGCCSCVSGLPKTALIAALTRVAGRQIPDWLRTMPAAILGTRVQLHSLAIPLS